MHCPHCGHELPDEASFCTNCGESMAKRPASAPATANEPNEPQVQATSDSEAPHHPNPQPTPQPQAKTQPEPQPEAQAHNAGGWQNSTAFRIAMLVLGVALVVIGIVRLLLAFHVFDPKDPSADSSSSSVVQTSSSSEVSSSSDNSSSSSSVKDEKVLAKDYTDSHGYVTLQALTELSGKQLHDVLSEIDYDQINNNDEIMLTNNSKRFALLIHQGKDGTYVGWDKIDDLDPGSTTDPVCFELVCGDYATIDDFLKNLGNIEFSKMEYANDQKNAYGIVKNSQGDEFLIYFYFTEKGAIVAEVYNAACTVTGGPIGNLGASLDEAYENLGKKLSGASDGSSSADSSSQQIEVSAEEVEVG